MFEVVFNFIGICFIIFGVFALHLILSILQKHEFRKIDKKEKIRKNKDKE